MIGNIVWDAVACAACGIMLIIVIVIKIHNSRRHK